MWIYDLKYYWRKWKAKVVLLFLFLLVLFWFRFQILGLIGNYLVCEDELQKVQVAFILGGNSQIRAEKAVEVYDLSISDHFICTGEHHNDLADYFEVPESEAALSKGFYVRWAFQNKMWRSCAQVQARAKRQIIFLRNA